MLSAKKNPSVQAERRRAQVEQNRAIQGKRFEYAVRIHVDGVGERGVQVNFPVYFFEHPTLSSSGELKAGSALVRGSYPDWGAGVAEWTTEQRGETLLYKGAFVVVVATGDPDQSSIIHLTFKGKALQNPLPAS